MRRSDRSKSARTTVSSRASDELPEADVGVCFDWAGRVKIMAENRMILASFRCKLPQGSAQSHVLAPGGCVIQPLVAMGLLAPLQWIQNGWIGLACESIISGRISLSRSCLDKIHVSVSARDICSQSVTVSSNQENRGGWEKVAKQAAGEVVAEEVAEAEDAVV
jgi:hypothetical protein